MIRETGARYVIVGHSERRTLFGDTNDTVNKKTHAALTAGLVPIVCIGETLDQRDRNETMAVLDRQIKESLDRVTGEQLSGMVLAYEPVWAIGTGRNATPAQAGEAHFHIRQRLKQWFGLDASERCRVLYGGSVKPDNIAKLIAEPDVDGALVGGASLDPKSFFAIIQGAARNPIIQPLGPRARHSPRRLRDRRATSARAGWARSIARPTRSSSARSRSRSLPHVVRGRRRSRWRASSAKRSARVAQPPQHRGDLRVASEPTGFTPS